LLAVVFLNLLNKRKVLAEYMANLGSRTQSFIVRIWFESRDNGEFASELRGVVEQVSTGDRRYFSDVSEMLSHILSFLKIAMESGDDQQ